MFQIAVDAFVSAAAIYGVYRLILFILMPRYVEEVKQSEKQHNKMEKELSKIKPKGDDII